MKEQTKTNTRHIFFESRNYCLWFVGLLLLFLRFVCVYGWFTVCLRCVYGLFAGCLRFVCVCDLFTSASRLRLRHVCLRLRLRSVYGLFGGMFPVCLLFLRCFCVAFPLFTVCLRVALALLSLFRFYFTFVVEVLFCCCFCCCWCWCRCWFYITELQSRLPPSVTLNIRGNSVCRSFPWLLNGNWNGPQNMKLTAVESIKRGTRALLSGTHKNEGKIGILIRKMKNINPDKKMKEKLKSWQENDGKIEILIRKLEEKGRSWWKETRRGGGGEWEQYLQLTLEHGRGL